MLIQTGYPNLRYGYDGYDVTIRVTTNITSVTNVTTSIQNVVHRTTGPFYKRVCRQNIIVKIALFFQFQIPSLRV